MKATRKGSAWQVAWQVAWKWALLALALGLLWLTLRTIPLTEVWAQLSQLRLEEIALLVAANVLVLATFNRAGGFSSMRRGMWCPITS